MSAVQRAPGVGNLLLMIFAYAFIIITVMFVVTFVCAPLLLLALFDDRCKHTEHVCPTCNHIIAINKTPS